MLKYTQISVFTIKHRLVLIPNEWEEVGTIKLLIPQQGVVRFDEVGF